MKKIQIFPAKLATLCFITMTVLAGNDETKFVVQQHAGYLTDLYSELDQRLETIEKLRSIPYFIEILLGSIEDHQTDREGDSETIMACLSALKEFPEERENYLPTVREILKAEFESLDDWIDPTTLPHFELVDKIPEGFYQKVKMFDRREAIFGSMSVLGYVGTEADIDLLKKFIPKGEPFKEVAQVNIALINERIARGDVFPLPGHWEATLPEGDVSKTTERADKESLHQESKTLEEPQTNYYLAIGTVITAITFVGLVIVRSKKQR